MIYAKYFCLNFFVFKPRPRIEHVKIQTLLFSKNKGRYLYVIELTFILRLNESAGEGRILIGSPSGLEFCNTDRLRINFNELPSHFIAQNKQIFCKVKIFLPPCLENDFR